MPRGHLVSRWQKPTKVMTRYYLNDCLDVFLGESVSFGDKVVGTFCVRVCVFYIHIINIHINIYSLKLVSIPSA